jgi:hypothetical protein
MKKLLIISSFAFLICCNRTQTETLPTATAETTVVKTREIIQAENAPEISLDDLTGEQKKKLDKALPPKVREILDNAEELEILAHLDKETGKPQVMAFGVAANTVAKISDASLKKAILDRFYFDAASDKYGASLCWNPRHILRVKSKDGFVGITICFECNIFKGSSSFGEIAGNVSDGRKSMALINEAIEKYGVDMQ